MSKLDDIREALYAGNAKAVVTLTQQALDDGVSPACLLSDGLIQGMDVVGTAFRNGTLFVPEVLIAAKAMKQAMSILQPFFIGGGIKSTGFVLIGTVKGDLHDIGKNLVGMMLEGGGFRVHDLGTDVPPEQFVASIRSEKPDLVGLSALLTTTMATMKVTIDAIKEAGLREQVKVMVGGAPVTESYAKQIGADGYAPDASTAVMRAKELINS